MKARTFLLLSLAFSLLQGPFFPVVFSEGILLSMFASYYSHGGLVYHSAKRIIPFLFLSGIFFDFFQNQQIGVTPLIFIIFGGCLFVFKEQFPWNKPVFLALPVILINLVRGQIVFGIIPVFSAVAAALFTIGVSMFITRSYEGRIGIK